MAVLYRLARTTAFADRNLRRADDPVRRVEPPSYRRMSGVRVSPRHCRAACSWLKDIEGDITFGDSPPEIGFRSWRSQPADSRSSRCRKTRSTCFRSRSCKAWRIGCIRDLLADTGDDHARTWQWGAGQNIPDAAILAYGRRRCRAASLVAAVRKRPSPPMAAVSCTGDACRTGEKGWRIPKFSVEPFGFVDGVSQPIIRGTKRWMRQADEIHTVEPGEFLLGLSGQSRLPAALADHSSDGRSDEHADGDLSPLIPMPSACRTSR